MVKNLLVILTILLCSVFACVSSEYRGYDIVKLATSAEGMVVSAHPLATEVGVEILAAGGNAIDAMIATHMALAVVYPRAGNIAGGGFMVYRQADGKAFSLDYREKAPAAASRDMYLDTNGDVIDDLSTRGHLAVGVPGSVAGMSAAHGKFGSLEWKALIEPSINLAREGFHITENEASRLNSYSETISEFNSDACPFVKKNAWNEGDLIVQTQLANTMQAISEFKADGFYRGKVADAIVEEMVSGNGLITHRDLEAYSPLWREPQTTEYDSFRIISMPPSSSGGIALIQMLEMIEPYPIDQYGFQSKEAMHLMIEAERRAYADRAEYVGDMDFFNVPVDMLLDSGYLNERMNNFDTAEATPSNAVEVDKVKVGLESYETTHLTAVDKAGNAVSVTTTLNSNYGSKVWVDGGGFFLNNEMDDFSIKPGYPNQFGLLGAEANSIVPGKRMLSSMTPTIVEKNDDFFMTIGTPGGATIITSVLQVFLNVAEFGMSASEAVQAPRFHHQWMPEEIIIEPDVAGASTLAELKEMGHTFRDVKYIGLVEVIQYNGNGTYIGIADRRGDDHAAGPHSNIE